MNSLPGKVIMFCGTNRGDAKDCVDWAVDAMCCGEDSPSLRILAGFTPPLSTFEVRDYASKALRELNIEIPQGAEAISAYARDLVEEIIKTPETMQRNLRILCDMCIAEDYQKDIYDFYMLRWAYDDLQQEEIQWYWNGADRSNIHEIILNRCRTWLEEYKSEREQVETRNPYQPPCFHAHP
jgi:hypothetical protein